MGYINYFQLSRRVLISFVFLVWLLVIGTNVSAQYINAPPAKMILTLGEAIEIAGQNNLHLANASIEARKAQKDKEIANRAGYPEISIEGSYTRLDEGESEPVTIPGFGSIDFGPPDSNANVALSASMPLYTGGRISAIQNRASISQNVVSQRKRAVYGDIILAVTTTFYGLLSSQEEVKITEEALTVSNKHLSDVRSLLQQGMVARLDLIRTELDLAERERDLSAAQTRSTLAAERLSALLFPDRPVSIIAQGPLPEPDPLIPLEDWIRKAQDASPELVSARLNIELAQTAIDSATSDVKPNLALFSHYGSEGEEPTIDNEDHYWNAGISFSIPLYQGGRTTRAVEREKETKVQAENHLVLTRRETRTAIVESTALMKLAASEYATALKAIEAGEENLRVTTLKYQHGLVINTDVIDAQLSLTRSRLLRISALKNYHTNRALLLRIVGSIEERP